jgi:hypothetical protein
MRKYKGKRQAVNEGKSICCEGVKNYEREHVRIYKEKDKAKKQEKQAVFSSLLQRKVTSLPRAVNFLKSE